MTTTQKPSLRTLTRNVCTSQNAANRYRFLAEHMRKLDPTYSDSLVNEEVARLINLAQEMEEDAEHNRELALSLYTLGQIQAANDAYAG